MTGLPGFRPDYAFVEAPVLDARGRPVHARGVTAVPGLYFLELPWQSTRGSEDEPITVCVRAIDRVSS